MVVLGFMTVLTGLSFSNLISFDRTKRLESAVVEVVTLLQDQQQKTALGIADQNIRQSKGIVFSSDHLVQFTTPSDYVHRLTNQDLEYHWPENIACQTISLPQDCDSSHDCVIFTQSTGFTPSVGSVTFRDTNTGYLKTIHIQTNGKIYYD